MMAKSKLACDFPAGGRQGDVAVGRHTYEPVLLQAAQGHGDRRGRYFQPMRQGGGNHRLALALGFENGLEIVLFRNSNHVGIIRRRLSTVNRIAEADTKIAEARSQIAEVKAMIR